MAHFLGEFDCKLDAKGRMMIPVGLKKQLPEAVNEGHVFSSARYLLINQRPEVRILSEHIDRLSQAALRQPCLPAAAALSQAR